MKCSKPFVSGGVAYGCGQCNPCRYDRRRQWMARIMLESLCHSDSCFLTLSYSDATLPLTSPLTGRVVGSLEPLHLRDWLKRLRSRIEPLRLRFYAVGEYGDRTMRPHYHVILFGFQTCLRGRTLRRLPSSEPLWSECCDRCRLIGETWGKGLVDLGTVTSQSASYCAEYVVKKMTRFDDPRLAGRYPEFRRSSLKPGIGCDAMFDVAAELIRFDVSALPRTIRLNGKEVPLARYLRKKLSEFSGVAIGAQEALEQMEDALHPLRAAARASTENPSFRSHIVKAGEGARLQLDAKESIFKVGKKL